MFYEISEHSSKSGLSKFGVLKTMTLCSWVPTTRLLIPEAVILILTSARAPSNLKTSNLSNFGCNEKIALAVISTIIICLVHAVNWKGICSVCTMLPYIPKICCVRENSIHYFRENNVTNCACTDNLHTYITLLYCA